jgi:hypothetical protein
VLRLAGQNVTGLREEMQTNKLKRNGKFLYEFKGRIEKNIFNIVNSTNPSRHQHERVCVTHIEIRISIERSICYVIAT